MQKLRTVLQRIANSGSELWKRCCPSLRLGPQHNRLCPNLVCGQAARFEEVIKVRAPDAIRVAELANGHCAGWFELIHSVGSICAHANIAARLTGALIVG